MPFSFDLDTILLFQRIKYLIYSVPVLKEKQVISYHASAIITLGVAWNQFLVVILLFL